MAAGRVGGGGRAAFLAGAAHLWARRRTAPLAVGYRIHPRPGLHFAYQTRPSGSGLRAFGWHGGPRRRALHRSASVERASPGDAEGGRIDCMGPADERLFPAFAAAARALSRLTSRS